MTAIVSAAIECDFLAVLLLPFTHKSNVTVNEQNLLPCLQQQPCHLFSCLDGSLADDRRLRLLLLLLPPSHRLLGFNPLWGTP